MTTDVEQLLEPMPDLPSGVVSNEEFGRWVRDFDRWIAGQPVEVRLAFVRAARRLAPEALQTLRRHADGAPDPGVRRDAREALEAFWRRRGRIWQVTKRDER